MSIPGSSEDDCSWDSAEERGGAARLVCWRHGGAVEK